MVKGGYSTSPPTTGQSRRLDRPTSVGVGLGEPGCLGGRESEKFRHSLGLLVGLEVGEEVVDERDAPWCADTTRDAQ